VETETGRESPLVPHLRAAFVAFHLVAIGLMALPAPEGGLNRSTWQDPTVKAELTAWHDRLVPGWTQERFEAELYRAASGVMKVRQVTLAPFRWYYDLCGTDQTWRMFVAPQTVPTRLEIDLQDVEGGAWHPIFVERSAEWNWRATQLGNERMRSAIFRYGWKHYQKPERQLGAWLAARAAVDFPTAHALRTRWYRYRTPSPKQVMAGSAPAGKYERSNIYPLKPLRSGR
jgi:hypothetical protein